MASIKYRKNYHSNGYGWHNLAAMGYAKPPAPAQQPLGYPPSFPSGPNGTPYPNMASLSMPMPGMQAAAPNYSMGMPPLPGAGSYQDTSNVGFQLSYGFAPSVLPSQIPNAPRHHSTAAVPYPAAPSSTPAGPGIGWAIGLGNSTDVHDPHQAQAESKYESIFVPNEDRPIYSNMRFFDVSKDLINKLFGLKPAIIWLPYSFSQFKLIKKKIVIYNGKEEIRKSALY